MREIPDRPFLVRQKLCLIGKPAAQTHSLPVMQRRAGILRAANTVAANPNSSIVRGPGSGTGLLSVRLGSEDVKLFPAPD